MPFLIVKRLSNSIAGEPNVSIGNHDPPHNIFLVASTPYPKPSARHTFRRLYSEREKPRSGASRGRLKSAKQKMPNEPEIGLSHSESSGWWRAKPSWSLPIPRPQDKIG
jgi:hypothetical protein